MAYMSQDRKKGIALKLKEALKGLNIRYSLSVEHHSKIVMTISEGDFDFAGDRTGNDKNLSVGVNPYWFKEHYQGRSLELLEKIFPILNEGNHDNSDAMTDYFDVGWYVDVKIGKWNKPYILKGVKENVQN